VAKVVKRQGLACWTPAFGLRFVSMTKCAFNNVPGVSSKSTYQLCETINEGHLSMSEFTALVLTGQEQDNVVKTKFGSTPTVMLSALVSKVVTNLVASTMQNIRRGPHYPFDAGHNYAFLDNYQMKTRKDQNRADAIKSNLGILYDNAARRTIDDNCSPNVESIEQSLFGHMQDPLAPGQPALPRGVTFTMPRQQCTLQHMSGGSCARKANDDDSSEDYFIYDPQDPAWGSTPFIQRTSDSEVTGMGDLSETERVLILALRKASPVKSSQSPPKESTKEQQSSSSSSSSSRLTGFKEKLNDYYSRGEDSKESQEDDIEENDAFYVSF
jgi:hypothetical protein